MPHDFYPHTPPLTVTLEVLMTKIFEVETKDIESLSAVRLPRLLEKLLHAEALVYGIPKGSVEVGSNIHSNDGGEDGRIQWKGGPNKTDYLPSRFVQFQCKATKMAPKKCAKELVGQNGKFKPMVDQALSAGSTYILFINQTLNRLQKDRRVDAMRKMLINLDKPYAETAKIEIYDASSIQAWVNCHFPIIVAVLNWGNRPLVPYLKTWEQWGHHPDFQQFEYVEDEERQHSLKDVRELLGKERTCARIVGLPGLGKTRMAFELCRDIKGDRFSDKVVYYDAAFDNGNVVPLVHQCVTSELQGILIIDNCDLRLHKELKHQIENQDSRLSLLTLDYNPERDSNTRTICLNPLNDDLMKQMLESKYRHNIPDLSRVVSFAQGFPLMAVLIAEARLGNEANIGNLTDEEIVSRMLALGFNRQLDDEARKVLMGCSLFDKFGLDDAAGEEYKIIATSVTEVNTDSFYTWVKKYERHGIIDRRGRYAQVRPKPLAIHLAAEWWECSSPEKQQQLINSTMPGQLKESFCAQIEKLDFLPGVKKLAENLCGQLGPFGKAEVILSIEGSRLFRSLVEVNPQATSAALYRILAERTHAELEDISGNVRRNLVVALEKLCFHKSAFNKSAKCLMWLATAENEYWSNNSTGLFIQLFRTILSGTEALPDQRLEIIDYALNLEETRSRELSVAALGSAISVSGGSRVAGAEFQGSGTALEEWRPKIWQEAYDYWIAGIERLTKVVLDNCTESDMAKNAIATNIFALAKTNLGLVNALDTAIRRIVSKQGPSWPMALEKIRRLQTVHSGVISKDGRDMIEEWIQLLTPKLLGDRIEYFVSKSPFEYKKGKDGEHINLAAENAKKLAQELSGDVGQVVPYLKQLSTGGQRQGWTFGHNLVLASKKWEPLFTETLSAVSQAKQPNTSFLHGVLFGIYELNKKEWDTCMEKIFCNKKLAKFYPDATITGDVQKKHLNNVIELIKRNDAEIASVLALSYGQPLKNLDPKTVTEFINNLRGISHEAAWVGLDVLSMYCDHNEKKWNACETTLKELLANLSLSCRISGQQLDMYHWDQAVNMLLEKNDPDFAKQLAIQILDAYDKNVYHGDVAQYAKKAMRVVLRKYAKQVWPLISRTISDADPIQAFHFQFLFGSEISFDNKEDSILANLPEKVLRDWCESDPENVPVFVARSNDVFVKINDKFRISKNTKYLLDEFGNNMDMLNALSANMYSFGWSGSVVPLYRKILAAIEPLLQHQHMTVQKWAEDNVEELKKQIDAENQSDQESTWGIN